MDKRKQPQWIASGIVESSVSRVWTALLDTCFNLPEPEKKALELHEETGPFTFTAGSHIEGKAYFEIDKQKLEIAIQGQWWYRGTTRVESHEKGALVTYRVYNIAPGLGWWVARFIQGRENAKSMKPQLRQTLDTIGARLKCAAYLNE
ncbi:MAG: hypothetical protein ACJ74W_19280 [Pyrinomonadaceae bacterium]